VSGTGYRPRLPSFSPAKSIKDAEKWMQANVAEKVKLVPENYSPMDLDFVNTINKTVYEVTKGKKLKGVIYDHPWEIAKALEKKNLGNMYAALHEDVLYIVRKAELESEEAFKSAVKSSVKAAKTQFKKILSDLKAEYKVTKNKSILAAIKEIEKEGVKPWMLAKTRKDLVRHEMGHWIESKNKALQKIATSQTNKNVSSYKKLSEYQNLLNFETSHWRELIPEYFVAYKNNLINDIPDEILGIFKKMELE
jgi:hypothetical protein